jgi:hypothetical protein
MGNHSLPHRLLLVAQLAKQRENELFDSLFDSLFDWIFYDVKGKSGASGSI